MDAMPAAMFPLGGIVLLIVGAALIVSGARLNRQMLARRIDRLQPPVKAESRIVHRRKIARASSLVRAEVSGLPAQQQREAARRLARLGLPAEHAQAIHVGLRVLSVTAGAALALLLGTHLSMFRGSHIMPLLLMIMLGISGWFLPTLVLSRLAKRRAKAAADGLPDALELLVVCVEAGLSLEDGIDRIIGELDRSQPALAAELALTSADLKILPSRDQALANLAERVDVPSVRSVVSTLTQTLRYGTPLAQAMRVVAAEMRTAALINLEERANRLPAIMTVPMMLFIMPVIFLIVGGPAVLRLLDILAHR
jgi:tight adherence protein C